ncbi:MAG: hypothetical protein KKA05_03595 [Alphaproteobacteria bacterium]|nr:hypothetical protein [Alphaproteobacteria bacterium]
MSMTTVAVGVVAAGAAVAGATAGGLMGLPLAGVFTAAAAAGTGAGGASLLSMGLASGFDGKGPSAGVAGLFLMAAAHVTAVPAADVAATTYALRGLGFI